MASSARPGESERLLSEQEAFPLLAMTEKMEAEDEVAGITERRAITGVDFTTISNKCGHASDLSKDVSIVTLNVDGKKKTLGGVWDPFAKRAYGWKDFDVWNHICIRGGLCVYA